MLCYVRGFFSAFFFNVYIWLSQLSSKKVKNNSISFLNRRAEENSVVNNKDNRVFMSRNYRYDSLFFLYFFYYYYYQNAIHYKNKPYNRNRTKDDIYNTTDTTIKKKRLMNQLTLTIMSPDLTSDNR